MKFRSGFRAHNPMVSLVSQRESRRHSKASLTFLSGIQRAPTGCECSRFESCSGACFSKSRNFTGQVRVSQYPLYFKNGEDLSHQTSHPFTFLLPLKRVNKLTFQNVRLAVSQMAFWVRNVFETFEKQAADH